MDNLLQKKHPNLWKKNISYYLYKKYYLLFIYQTAWDKPEAVLHNNNYIIINCILILTIIIIIIIAAIMMLMVQVLLNQEQHIFD